MVNEINVGYFVNLDGSKLTLKDAAELLERAASHLDIGKSSDIGYEIDDSILPHAYRYNPSQKCGEITVRYPLELFDPIDGGLSELLNVILGENFGNLKYKQIRLDWVELPKRYTSCFKGPAFGTEELKTLLKFDCPLLAINVRPNIGVSLDYFIKKCKIFVENGVNMIVEPHTSPILPKCKFNPNYTFKEKVKRVLTELKNFERSQPILYCPIIIGDSSTKLAYQIADIVDEVDLPEDIIVSVGLSFSPASFSRIRHLSQDKTFNLPVWAHDTLHSVMTCRNHRFVVNHTVLVQLARLAGADLVNAGSLSAETKYAMPIDNLKSNFEILNIRTNEWNHIKKSLYVAAGSINPLWIYKHIYNFNSLDMAFVAGGYVHNHRKGDIIGVSEMLAAIKHASQLFKDKQTDKQSFEEEITKIEQFFESGKTFGDFLIGRDEKVIEDHEKIDLVLSHTRMLPEMRGDLRRIESKTDRVIEYVQKIETSCDQIIYDLEKGGIKLKEEDKEELRTLADDLRRADKEQLTNFTNELIKLLKDPKLQKEIENKASKRDTSIVTKTFYTITHALNELGIALSAAVTAEAFLPHIEAIMHQITILNGISPELASTLILIPLITLKIKTVK